MLNTETSALIYGLSSAVSWGAGDFSGGMATKKINPFTVILWIEVIGIGFLAALALLAGESLPGRKDLVMAGVAGVAGALGLASLYKGLAEGCMGVVAPLSAVMAAVIPIIVSSVNEGLPEYTKIIGFAAALSAVWILSYEPGRIGLRLETLRLPVLAGIGFGCYFVFIEAAADEHIFWTLVAARFASIAFLVVVLAFQQNVGTPIGRQWPFVLLAGIFDSSGNTFFALAAQAGRLDVSAVLASLYPGATVMLAMIFLKERLQKRHITGLAAALAALILISW
jgi:uncharacterized membrane protein